MVFDVLTKEPGKGEKKRELCIARKERSEEQKKADILARGGKRKYLSNKECDIQAVTSPGRIVRKREKKNHPAPTNPGGDREKMFACVVKLRGGEKQGKAKITKVFKRRKNWLGGGLDD